MNGRLLRVLTVAALLVALSAGMARAGGWATITGDASNPPQPNAGEELTFGFTVLQHGVTPAGWVNATFVMINGSTGERIEAKATGQGPDGHFVARLTPTSGGYWTWQVELSDLIVETAPRPMIIAAADGTVPQMDVATILAAIERTRSEIRTEFENRLGAQNELVSSEITTLSSQVKVLQAQRDTLKKQLDALSSRPAATAVAAPAPDQVPMLAIVAIAVMAGATSGFAMTLLGRSQRTIPATAGGSDEEAVPAVAALTTR